MAPLTLFLVALGVSADAFAVALGRGLQQTRLVWRDALLLAATFGLFQALMPVLGYVVGVRFSGQVTAVDHWIAFGLLAAIGARMVWEALHPDDPDDPDDPSDADRLSLRALLVLAVATSIDALAVGIGLAFLDVEIVSTAVVIGVTTFVLSLLGVLVGHRAGARFRGPAEVAGGLVLIAIGVKVLVDHLTA